MATLYWDPDLTSAGNDYGTGAGLGGAGSWDTTAGGNQEWVDSSGTRFDWNNAAGDSAVFFGSAGAVTLGAPISAAGLEFKTDAYSLASNTLTLTGAAIVDADAGVSATIGSVVAGSAGLNKNDTGTVTLAGINTYTGTAAINNGTLKLDFTSRVSGNINFGAIAVGAAGTLELFNTNATVDNPTGLVNGPSSITGSGIINKTGAGYIDLWNSGGNATSIKNFTGQINVVAGTLASNGSDWNTSAGLMSLDVASGAFFDIRTGGIVIDKLTGAGTVGSSHNQTVSLSLGNNGGTANFTGNIRNGGTFSGGANTGVIAVTKNGAGTQTIGNINYSGGATVNNGTLKLDLTSRSTGAQLNLGTMNVAAVATLELGNTVAASYSTCVLFAAGTTVTGSGTVTKTGTGIVDFWNGSSIKDFAGLIDIQGGVLANQTNGAAAWSGSAGNMSLNIASGAYFDLRTDGGAVINNLTGTGTIGSSFSAGMLLTVGAQGGSSTFGGVIQNTVPLSANAPTVALTKNGAGTLILTNNNTYTGATTINQGMLQVGANSVGVAHINNSSGVSVAANSTFRFFRGDTSQLTLLNTFSGAGNIRLSGAGTVDTASQWTTSVNNTAFTGTWVLDGARFNVTSQTAVGPSSTVEVQANGQLLVNGAFTLANNIIITDSSGWRDSGFRLGAIRMEGASNLSGNLTLNQTNTIINGDNSGLNAVLSGYSTGNHTLSGVISGPGEFSLSRYTSWNGGTVQAVNFTLSGTASNTYTGKTVVDGQGAVASLILAKTGGAKAIPANNVVQVGSVTGGQANLRMGADDQFGSGAVINFVNVSGQWGRFDLTGTSQTVAGINTGNLTTLGSGVVQNTEAAIPGTLDGTLTLNGTGTYVYNGHLRNGGTGLLSLVKGGTGAQTLSAPNAANNARVSYTGPTTVNGGTLELRDLNGSLPYTSTTTVNNGGTVIVSNTVNQGMNAAFTLNNGATLAHNGLTNGGSYWTNSQAVTVAAGANVTLNEMSVANTTGTNKGMFLDGGLKGGGSGAVVTINATNAGNAVSPRNNNSDFSGLIIVNGIASSTVNAGSGIGVGGNTTGLQNADIQLNGTMELLNQGVGWANTASGAFRMGALSGSGVMIGNFTSGGTTTVTLGNTNNNGTFSGVIANGTGNVVNLVKIGTGTQKLTGANAYNLTTINDGVLQIGDAGATGTLGGGAVVVTAPGNLTFNRTNAYAVPVGISGTGSLTHNGSGTTTLSGTSITYTGATTINSGTLELLGATAYVSATTVNSGGTMKVSNSANQGMNAAINLNNGGTLTHNGLTDGASFWTNSQAVTVAAGANVTLNETSVANTTGANKGAFLDGGLKGGGGGAIVTINATNAGNAFSLRNNNSDFSGQIVVNGIASSTVNAGSGLGVGGNTTGLQNADIQLNGTLELLNQGVGWANTASGQFRMGALSGTGVMVGNFTSGGVTTVTLGNTNAGGTFSGVIANGTGNVVHIVKTGSGTQTLSGVNTYTGNTTITGGVLSVSSLNGIGPLSGAGYLAVQTGGTFQYTGTGAETRTGLFYVNSGAGSIDVTSATGNPTIVSTGGDVSAGGGSFTKSGPGTFTFSTAVTGNNVSDTFAKPVVISAGTLALQATNAATKIRFTSSVAGAAGTQIKILAGPGVVQNDNNAVNWSTNLADLDVASGAVFDLYADPVYVNKLTGSGVVQNGYGNASGQSGSAPFFEKLIVGSNGGSSTFDGVLRNNPTNGTPASANPPGGGLQLEKVGAGVLTLTGVNTYTGSTTITAGTLQLGTSSATPGSIANSAVTVTSGASLTGWGTVGPLTVQAGGNVAPGFSPGIVNSGNLNVAGNFNAEINTGVPVAGTTYDQTIVTGTVTLSGALVLSTSAPRANNNGDVFTLIKNDGTDLVSGTFAGLAEGAYVQLAGVIYQVTYVYNSDGGAVGNDVALLDATSLPLYWDADGAGASTGGTGTWDTSTLQWHAGSLSGPLVAWNNANLDDAIFPTSAGTVTLAGNMTARSLAFQVGGYTVQSNTVTLAGGTGVIDVTAGTATVGSVVAGSTGLTKTGAGTLALTAAATYTGATAVNAGTLNIGGGGATGSIPLSPLTVALGATLAFDYSTAFTAAPLTVTGNLSYTSAAQLSLSGTYGANQITAVGNNVLVAGALTINAGAGAATITGTSATAAGITSTTNRNITTTGDVTFFGTSTAGSFIDGISLAGVYTATAGTLTFDGTAGAAGAYGFENGVSGSWAGTVSTVGNVVFKGTGGTTRNSDLNVGALSGNGNVTLLGRSKGLNTSASFNASGGQPYNVSLQTTAGGINGLLGAGSDVTGNGTYTVNSAAGMVIAAGRTINTGTNNLSVTAANQLSLAGTFTGNQITMNGNNVLVNGAIAINAGAGGATVTGNSASAAGITSNSAQNITTTGNVTFFGTSTAGSFIDGISLAGVYTATTGTLTFDGVAGAAGAYGFETGVSGSWAGTISTFGNVVFKGTGGTTRNSDLNVGALTGNGTVSLIGRSKGLNTVANFNASGGLPYNVSVQTTAGGINGLLTGGSDNTVNGSYTVNSAAGAVFNRTINTGTNNLSATATNQLSLAGTYGGNQITVSGNNVLVNGAIAINAGAGGATVTGNSASAAGITSNSAQNITTTGNVTFFGTSTAGSFIDGISLAGVYTATTGTLTFDGVAGAAGAYGFETGVSGSWAGTISTFGNVVFKGTGGTTRNSDLNVGALTGNGNVSLLGRSKGLNTIATFNASGGLPYNVSLQTTSGGIGNLLSAGSDNTGNGNYTINSAAGVAFTGRTINTGTGVISLTSGSGYSVAGNTSLQSSSLTFTDNNGVTLSAGANLSLNTTSAIANVLSGSGNVVVAGGLITLTAANIYTGTTSVNAGRLNVNGSLANGPAATDVTVAAGATLGGTGTIAGTVNVLGGAPGGHLSPGTSPGALTSGDLTLNSGSTFDVEIGGVTAGTTYDQQIVTGTVTLNTPTLNLLQFGGFTIDGTNQSYTIIDNDGVDAVTGTFAGLPEGSPVTYAGGTVYISYRGGVNNNDVVLYNQPHVNGTPAADALVLRRFSATQNEFSLNGAAFVQVSNTLPFSFDGLAGTDTLLVDTSNGDPLPTGDVNYTGEILRVEKTTGAASESATYAPGVVTIGGMGAINLTGAVNVDFVNFVSVTVNSAVANDTLTLQDGVTAANGATIIAGYDLTAVPALTVSGAGSSLVGLRNITNVVIDTVTGGGNGDDAVTINSGVGAHGNVNLTINTGAGTDTVTATGALTVGGAIDITSETIAINATLTGGAASTITLTASGAITTSGAGIDVAAASLVANAVTGIDLDTDVTNLTAATSGAGSITLDEANGANVLNVVAANGNATVTSATGNLNVTTVSATNITLNATTGAITDANAGAVNVTATLLDATGAAGIDLDTTIAQLTAGSTNAAILIRETNGVAVNTVNAGTGTVTLTLAAGAVTDNNGEGTLNVTAGLFDVTAPGGVNLDTNAAALTAATTSAAIVIREADSVAVNTLSAGTATVSFAAGGAITDGNAAANNVTAASLLVTAAGGIALDTTVGQLAAANTTSGVIAITNTGALNITTLSEPSIGSVSGVTNSAGAVTIVALSPLTVSSPVSALGAVTLTATDNAGAGDNLAVNATVTSTGSSVTLNAGDNATISANLSAATTVAINIDAGDADPATGATLNIPTGIVITATGATFIGANQADSFNFAPQATTPIQVFGLQPVANPGGDAMLLDTAAPVTNPTLNILGGQGAGLYTFGNRANVQYSSIENAATTTPIHIALDATATGVENIRLQRSNEAAIGADFEVYNNTTNDLLYAGPIANVLSFTFLGSLNANTVTIDDVNGLVDLAGTVPAPTGVGNNANVTGIPEIFVRGAGGTDAVVFANAADATDQVYGFGTGSAAGSQAGEVYTTNGPRALSLYFDGVEGVTSNDATPADLGTLTIVGDANANTISLTSSAGGTTVGATGYVPFTFAPQAFNAAIVNAGDGADSVTLASLNAAESGLALTLNGEVGADAITVESASVANTLVLQGGVGNDAYNLGGGLNTVDGILSVITVNDSAGVDSLTLNDSADLSGDTVTINDSTIDGVNGAPSANVTFNGIEALDVTTSGGADTVKTTLNATNGLVTVNVRGAGGDDDFFLNTADGMTGLTTINLIGDAGNDDFGSAMAPIHPLAGTTTNVAVYGDTTAITTNPGGAITDHLFLDMTTTSAGLATNPLVIVDTVTGQATTANTRLLRFGGIDDIDLYDGGVLTDVAIGDLYLRATNQADNLVFYRENNGVYIKRNGTPVSAAPYAPTNRIVAYGRDGNDYLEFNFTLGSTLSADFRGENDNDTIVGGLGNDLLVGGGGNDSLKGGDGNDVIYGEDQFLTTSPIAFDVQRATGLVQPTTLVGGNDTLEGGNGNDFLFGGTGADSLNGGLGNDYLHGGDGGDTLNSGGGNDILRGEAGADLINGDAGNDIIVGGSGDDRIFGRGNRDFMLAGAGADQIQDDEASNDVVVAGGLLQDNDNSFAQPGASLTGLNDYDLALQALMFNGPNAWSGAAPFATRVANLSPLTAIINDTVTDIILGNVAGQDYIISNANDQRLNTTGDQLLTV